MTAPERFADSQIPLAPRAPSIHDPQATLRRRWVDRVDFRAWSSSPFDREDTPFAGDTFEGLAAAVAKAQPRAGD